MKKPPRAEGGGKEKNMEGNLEKEVYELALLVTKELQKNPAKATPEMLVALRGCAMNLMLKTTNSVN